MNRVKSPSFKNTRTNSSHAVIYLGRAFLLISIFIASFSISGCKAFEKSKSQEKVREQSTETLPDIDVGTKESDAAAERLRPSAHLPGTVTLIAGGTRSCLATRIHEKFFLTAASCVMEPATGFPRPAYLPGIKISLGWPDEAQSERRVFAQTKAIYIHPSYTAHFKPPTAQDVYDKTDRLGDVADIALLALEIETSASSQNLALPPVVKLATQKPQGGKDFVALQGYCGEPLSSLKTAETQKEPPSINGGRILSTEINPSQIRAYLSDTYSNVRALFDCEGFRGAPVLSEDGKEVIAVTSWVQPGSLERGITLLGDTADDPQIGSWIASVISEPPPYTAPAFTHTISCAREVSSGLGTFKLSFAGWPALFQENPRGALAITSPTFDLELTITAPQAELVTAGSPPLIAPGSSETLQQKYKMLRDLRQPSMIQFLSADKLSVNTQDVLVSFVSTDRENSLAVISAYDSKAKKERTVNIYFNRFDSEEHCKLVPIEKNKEQPLESAKD